MHEPRPSFSVNIPNIYNSLYHAHYKRYRLTGLIFCYIQRLYSDFYDKKQASLFLDRLVFI